MLLADQDRSRWDGQLLAQGLRSTAESLVSPLAGRFALQAAIAGVHAVAPAASATDWRRILRLYDTLLEVWPSPVVSLNRAVALSFVDGPAAALAVVRTLDDDPRLAAYPYLPATRADLQRRLDRFDEAAASYREALALTGNEAERRFLADRPADAALNPWGTMDVLVTPDRRGSPTPAPKELHVSKAVLVGVGALLVMMGLIWGSQGMGWIGGSVMTGVTFWAVVGPIIAVVGLALVFFGLRGRRSP